jgi:hypothetical protein
VPLPALLGPHFTFLSLCPWCRARVMSSTTTVLAPPPSNTTTPRRPTAPSTCRYLGEPRLQSPCPAHPPFSGGALTEDLAASHPSMSHCRLRHRAGHSRGDRAPSARRLGLGLDEAGRAASAGGRGSKRAGAPRSAGHHAEGPRPWAGFGPCAV